MAQVVDVTLTAIGADTGNFTVRALTNADVEIVVSGAWPKTAQTFIQNVAKRFADVPDTAYKLKVESNTTSCTNSLTMVFLTS